MIGAHEVPSSASGSPVSPPSPLELLDTRPSVNVQEDEYRRLLGYPKTYLPGERALELSAWARQWYAKHGRPWVYLREVELQVGDDALRIDGTEFHSKQLHDHLLQAKARRAMLVVVSAGKNCEDHARSLWEEAKPDEYFFLEMYGSAVVEHLMATMSGRICDVAEPNGFMAVPHYSPGYTGWNVADQNKLFDLIIRGLTQPFPESLEVMTSGMLRPKKSLLAVVGLAPNTGSGPESARIVPCESCSFSPCNYRRTHYRHATLPAQNAATSREHPAADSPLTRGARYSVNARALRKWAQERVQIDQHDDGSVSATFRFDGTTCSSQGHPLAFEYALELSGPDDRYLIREAVCRPAAGDKGHTFMCAYLNDADTLMSEIFNERPLLGRPINDVLGWIRDPAPAGCYCTASSRAHKWGLALEAIHFTLAQAEPRAATPITS